MSFLNLRKAKKEEPKATAKKLVAKEAPARAAVKTVSGAGTFGTSKSIILRPRITEKASAAAEKGAYVFDVNAGANKREIAKAVASFYKVTPVKVTVVTIPAKRIIVKGRYGVSSGGKKAYVFLKKGEKIEVV